MAKITNIPCITDRSRGGQFVGVDEMSLKHIGTKISNTVLARYYKGAEGDNSNIILVKKEKING